MKKFLKRVGLIALLVALAWCGMLIADRQRLNEELIRLHVVANSDSDADQAVKLQVRDAVIASLQQGMADITDVEQAKAYLSAHLPELETLANRVLAEAGFSDRAKISLALEEFPTRVYDTFSLPSGVYESLRIVIGNGEGQNWWCVVFPSLCLAATTDGFQDTAVSAGFPDTLTNTLTGQDGYEVRFFLLDCLGKLENLFFRG